jgi:hypothetical protein
MCPFVSATTLREMARITATLAVTISFILLPSAAGASATDHGKVVLGKKNLLRYGIGWGTPRPPLIFNGGDPSGRAWNLRWSGWGAGFAVGRGLTWILSPHGGYYKKPGVVEFRAYRLARCSRAGPRAYTRLQVRAALRPGGPLSRWFAWGGWRSICHWP